MSAHQLITEHIDLWTSTIKARKTQGRGSSKKRELYGIKKLRELILELAVRGKLVPQDPSDEPASVLLERISEEKAQLIKDKKIKNHKPLPAITDEERPFDLPGGWEVARFGDLTSRLGSGSTPRGGKDAYVSSGIPFLRSQNVWNDGLKLDDVEYITNETHFKMDNTKVVPGDVLLNITGASLGRSTIFPKEIEEANVSQHVTIIRLLDGGMARFVHLGILSPLVQRLVWGRQVGMAIEGLSKKVLEQFEFPIPPLNEQHRIVAKVDELMALCDQLEQQTESSLDAHKLLVDTLLSTLTDARDANEISDNWARLADHFDTLITTDYAVERLKQTILQLAVMGKLVPQDPNDEPASELLKRIAAEKEQLIKDKKIKKQKPLPEVAEAEKPFELPLGWEWGRLGKVCRKVTDGAHNPPANSGFGYPMLSCKEVNFEKIDFSSPSRFVDQEGFDKEDKRTSIAPGDILLNIVASIGRSAVVPHDAPKFVLQRNVAVLDSMLNPQFFTKYLISPVCISYYNEHAKGTAQKVIYLGKLSLMPLALPPSKEQDRIVTKVDELMTLCDQLKARLNDAQTTQLHLADTVVDEALS